MNRGALGYVVTLIGTDQLPFIAWCTIEQTPEGYRVAVDDGGAQAYWHPSEGYVPNVDEDDDHMTLRYDRGLRGERGLELQPVNVERWNQLTKRRPEMTPVKDFDDLQKRLR